MWPVLLGRLALAAFTACHFRGIASLRKADPSLSVRDDKCCRFPDGQITR